MNTKVLVEVYVPSLDVKYNVFVPASKIIGNLIIDLVKGIHDLSDGAYPINASHILMNSDTCMIYKMNMNIKDANILNGTKLVLM